ncbi:hypothetical protein [Pseudonocardia halophobica]|nr:hypothetical protein [Pseudonocardia halophobica]
MAGFDEGWQNFRLAAAQQPGGGMISLLLFLILVGCTPLLCLLTPVAAGVFLALRVLVFAVVVLVHLVVAGIIALWRWSGDEWSNGTPPGKDEAGVWADAEQPTRPLPTARRRY